MCYELMTYWSGRLSGGVFPSTFDTSSHPDADGFVASLRDFVAASPDRRYRVAAERLLDSGKPFLSVIPMRAHASVGGNAGGAGVRRLSRPVRIDDA